MCVVRLVLRAASADAGILLDLPRTQRKTFQDRSFSIAATVAWNSLPSSIRVIDNLDSFKKSLKTYMFKIAF